MFRLGMSALAPPTHLLLSGRTTWSYISVPTVIIYQREGTRGRSGHHAAGEGGSYSLRYSAGRQLSVMIFPMAQEPTLRPVEWRPPGLLATRRATSNLDVSAPRVLGSWTVARFPGDRDTARFRRPSAGRLWPKGRERRTTCLCCTCPRGADRTTDPINARSWAREL